VIVETMEGRYIELDVRKRIYDIISRSPGLHFREIQRRAGVATGSVDYHLHFLHKHGVIRTEKTGRFLRYYPADVNFGQEEKDLLSLLRQERVRHILIFLIDRKRAKASDISAAIGISPSNLSWYLKSLKEKNVITEKKKGRFRFYSVVSRDTIVQCLLSHKSSFLDSIVDRFISAWELE